MVIFLDIDGVICTDLSTRLSALLRLPLERQIFDPLTLFWLRRLGGGPERRASPCSSWRDALGPHPGGPGTPPPGGRRNPETIEITLGGR